MTAITQVDPTSSLIVKLLEQKGLLPAEQVERLREVHSGDNRPIELTLVIGNFVSEQDIASAYSEHLFVPLYDPQDHLSDSKELAELLPEKLCRDLMIAPVGQQGDTLDLVFATPNEFLIIDEVQMRTGLNVRPLIASFSETEQILGQLFGGSDWKGNGLPSSVANFEEFDDGDETDEDDDDTDAGAEVVHLDKPTPPGRDGRVIRLVNQILGQALHEGASDIHLEPFEDGCKVRFRIDGKLNEISAPPRSLFIPIVSRLKVLAKMDIAEKRVPQDGAIALRTTTRRVDLRVSTVPTVNGEKMVLRVLDKGAIPCNLKDLGLGERQNKDLMNSLMMPHGLMLVTGPTGSGKSTTLYSCLNLMNQPDTNICTAEDPVEYKFEGINQVNVKSQIGLTFANVLRSFLRQDPDIIMVGEIRDQETADICLRAALTGHFVLSTLHTNDALSAITRLGEMGIEPFLLGSTLRVVEAQRLLRRLCPTCREVYECDSQTAERYGFDIGQTLYRHRGCEECRNTGYRGRVGVFEVVPVTPSLATMIQGGAQLGELRQMVAKEGIKTLFDSALDKVREGTTSLEIALTLNESMD